MKRLDRSIAGRMLLNFVLLFSVLFLFAATIDVILNLDEFTQIADKRLGDDASWFARITTALGFAVNYHLPQVFQFYAWLNGIVAVGAMGFTLAQMSRHRELVAIVASGMSLRRVAAPLIAVGVLLGLLQILNQEFMIPRIAPLLLRTHQHASQEAVDAFPIRFTDDADGVLVQAASFDPALNLLERPSFIERDDSGRTVRRTWARSAVWDPATEVWGLTDGLEVSINPDGRGSSRPAPAMTVETDLSPTRLLMRRYGQFAGMLSLAQIGTMLEEPDPREADALRRSAASRFAIIVVNVLVLLIALPFFLDRLPGAVFARTIACAVVVIPLYFTAAGFMLIPIPGVGPMVGVAIPVLVLIPLALARMGMVRT